MNVVRIKFKFTEVFEFHTDFVKGAAEMESQIRSMKANLTILKKKIKDRKRKERKLKERKGAKKVNPIFQRQLLYLFVSFAIEDIHVSQVGDI
jgi:ABC-type lipoprotein release transport system permease subunit